MLDILEEAFRVLNYSYRRIDGSTPSAERQPIIDEFTEDTSIDLFLLSTKAGGT